MGYSFLSPGDFPPSAHRFLTFASMADEYKELNTELVGYLLTLCTHISHGFARFRSLIGRA
jgi:hypothetical protein